MKYFVALLALFAITGHQGQVRFGQVPVPGAVVVATQGKKTLRTVTDLVGGYAFPEITDGTWAIQIEKAGFETVRREVITDQGIWNLNMLKIEDLNGESTAGFSKSATSDPVLQISSAEPEAADRLLINGTVNNGASTPLALPRAIGNSRRGMRSLYTAHVLFSGNNSLFDARSFSLTGQNTPQPAYNRLQSGITFGGPLQIPNLFRNGMFNVGYNRTQNRNASVQTAQMPTAAEREGDLSKSSH